MSLAFPMKFDLLEKFRRALFRSDGAEPGVRNPAEADYLVKMNIPPLLGRRDAACEYILELLTDSIKELELPARLEFYRMLLTLLEYAIVNTEAVAKILSSAETSARERRILAFLATLRDLLGAACALAEAGAALGDAATGLEYFLGKPVRLNRYAASGRDAEMRSLNLALDIAVAAAAKLDLYCDYNRKSFSTSNGERYHQAFAEFGASYRKERENTLKNARTAALTA